jgi:hypothetical protein
MRGYSTPHNSSGGCSGEAENVGCASMCQSRAPSRLRAAVRCEIPRWSSTRTSSSVSPEGSCVAPGLKTACAAYAQLAAVSRGLLACR